MTLDEESADLRGRTLIMSGGSRGIGLAIGVAAGRLGANVTLLAKTDTPHPSLPGTVHTAAQEIEAAGGRALAVVGDVRDESDVTRAVQLAVDTFGGIDMCVSNASALDLSGTEDLPVKKFDLMTQIQLRGTFLLTRAALPHLRRSPRPHMLTLSPPLNLAPRWLAAHPPYLLAKYGMTLLALGWAEEFREDGIASNALWPHSTIATAAVRNLLGGDHAVARSRAPEIMADAALQILRSPTSRTGNTYLDVDVLAAAGVTDLSPFGPSDVDLDLFVDE